MNDLNSVLVEGRLPRDPELSYTSTGNALCKFSIANNRYFKKKDEDKFNEEVSYFDVTVWGKLAEICNDNLHKGRGCRVVGRMKQDRWESETGGRSKINIIADHVEFKPEKHE